MARKEEVSEESKNTGTDDNIRSGADAPSDWEEEQTGFPPYWSPVEGKSFRGIVLARDDRDPEFIRFALRATVLVDCAEGPADDANPIIVKPGEFFTCSQYAALPLERYMGFEVWVQAVSKRKIDNGQTLWKFRLKCSSETKQLVQARQDKLLKEATDAGM